MAKRQKYDLKGKFKKAAQDISGPIVLKGANVNQELRKKTVLALIGKLSGALSSDLGPEVDKVSGPISLWKDQRSELEKLRGTIRDISLSTSKQVLSSKQFSLFGATRLVLERMHSSETVDDAVADTAFMYGYDAYNLLRASEFEAYEQLLATLGLYELGSERDTTRIANEYCKLITTKEGPYKELGDVVEDVIGARRGPGAAKDKKTILNSIEALAKLIYPPSKILTPAQRAISKEPKKYWLEKGDKVIELLTNESRVEAIEDMRFLTGEALVDLVINEDDDKRVDELGLLGALYNRFVAVGNNYKKAINDYSFSNSVILLAAIYLYKIQVERPLTESLGLGSFNLRMDLRRLQNEYEDHADPNDYIDKLNLSK